VKGEIMKKTLRCSFLALAVLVMFSGSILPSEEKPADMKPALLVIDIQERYLPMMDAREKDTALQMINAAIWFFRQHELPVIRVYHSDPQFGPKPEDKDFAFPSTVIIKEDDPKIIKNFPSAFKKTDLHNKLQDMGCNTIFLCGLSAVGCVLATYFGGNDLDYSTFMIKNAIISHNSTYTGFVQEICESVSLTTLRFMLDHMK
jgi:nicotinamidase-related amidase